MAAKKSRTVKKKRRTAGSKKKSASKASLVNELKKIMFGLMVLIACVLFFAMIADLVLHREKRAPDAVEETAVTVKTTAGALRKKTEQPPRTVSRPREAPADPLVKKQPVPVKKPATLPQKTVVTDKPFTFEIFDDAQKPVIHDNALHGPDEKPKIPRVAIIIDDIGYDRRMARAFYQLDPNLTFSILPLAPHGREIAEYLNTKGAALMLHLPMEPMEYPQVNPGPGAILADMAPDELLANLKRNLDDIPHISGVNNHMGSRVTAMSDKMNQIFTILKKRELFFIDSRTANDSQCRASARLLQVPFATRDVFLDNIQDPDYIAGQLEELLRIAEKRGRAIGIGHPYRATLDALRTNLPRFRTRIELVPASALAFIQG